MKVIFTKGIPGSGKSTWAKKFCEDNPDYVRVSRDDLRNMRGKYWIPQQEDVITAWEHSLIQVALNYDKNVIVDATNLNPRYYNQLVEMLKAWFPETTIEDKMFDTDVEVCILRDSLRPSPVGEKVIREFHAKYLKNETSIKQQ